MFRKTIIIILGCMAALAAQCAAAGETRILTARAIEGGMVEVQASPGVVVENPFDREGAAMNFVFTAPDGGEFPIPGFYYQGFERSADGETEKLTPAGGHSWRGRFIPQQAGEWEVTWEFAADGEVQRGEAARFEVFKDAEKKYKGFPGVSGTNKRYLAFDSGEYYFPVGLNVAWYGQGGTYDYDRWLEKLAANGVNYIRLWMPSWAFGIEWVKRDADGNVAGGAAGDYSGRMDRAWQLDYVMEKAGEYGMYVMLCVQNHGPLSLKHNSEWANNPYNAANGGPIAEPSLFYTDAEAKKLFKRRLDYVMARWGAYPAMFAWELFNEADLTEYSDQKDIVEWHQEMADYIRAADPYWRIVTTSVSNPKSELGDGLWKLHNIDMVQMHLYAMPPIITYEFAKELPARVEGLTKYGKPVLVGEAGVDFRGPSETLKADPMSAGFHNLLWAGLLSGSAGTAMNWWWDNLVDPQDLYSHFGPVADAVSGAKDYVGPLRTGCATAGGGGRNLETMSLCGEDFVIVWLKNPKHRWYKKYDDSTMSGAAASIEGVKRGYWRARWLDAYGPAPEGGALVKSAGGTLTLNVPDFKKDVALKLVFIDPDKRPAENRLKTGFKE